MTMVPFDGDITRCLKWMQDNAPAIQSLVNQKAQWYESYNTQFWQQWETSVFDIRTANNFGLMVWCIILGVPAGGLGLYPNVASFAFGDQRQNFIGDSSEVSDPSTGGNFYGGGSSSVGNIEEIRKLLQLRYVALTSRGNIAQTNRMLKFIFNSNDDWDFNAGRYFYVMDVNGTKRTTDPVTNLSVFRNDWQGNIQLSPNQRTNMVVQSTIPGAANSAWSNAKCLLGFANHWYGMVGTSVMATAGAPANTDALEYGVSGSYLGFKQSRYTITLFYKAGSSGRVRVGIADKVSGDFYGFSGVVGEALSNISSNYKNITVQLVEDILFDQNNDVRRMRILVSSHIENPNSAFSFGPNTVLKDKDAVIYGVHIQAGPDFNSFIATPASFASRSSPAAYYDETNKMVFAANNVARSNAYRVNKNGDLVNIGLLMEPSSTNLLTRQNTPPQWNVMSGTLPLAAKLGVDYNSAFSPDGVMSMDRIITLEDASPCVIVNPSLKSDANKAFCISGFFSAGENANFVTFRAYGLADDGNSRGIEASFDLKNGVVAKYGPLFGIDSNAVIGIWADVEAAGVQNGRQIFRCSIGGTMATGMTNGVSTFMYIPCSSPIFMYETAQRKAGDDVYAWNSGGFVLEQSTYPSTLIKPNTNFVSRNTGAAYIDSTGVMQTAAINRLRANAYAWDKNNKLQPIGDLTEASGSQLSYNTEDFASWSKSNSALNSDTAPPVSPTGAKMLSLVDNSVNGLHSIGLAMNVVSNAFYCGSVFVSKGTAKYLALIIGVDTNDCATVIFDTSDWSVAQVRNSQSSVFGCINYDSLPFGPGVRRLFVSSQIPAGVTNVSFSFVLVDSLGTWPPVYSGVGSGAYIWGSQFEVGVNPMSYFSRPLSTSPSVRGADILSTATTNRAADVPTSTAYVVDYSLTSASTGTIKMGQPPLDGAKLSWTGSWQGADQPTPVDFGTGDGSTVNFSLRPPLSLTTPTDAPFKLEYRVGPNMGLSSQLINLLNDESLELLPRTAGVKAVVIQEA